MNTQSTEIDICSIPNKNRKKFRNTDVEKRQAMKKNNTPEQAELVTDRRIQRTKQLLSEALMALVIEKGYEAVTVQDIIDRANVGRSTFYAHFENKEQLLFNGRMHVEKMLFGEEDERKERSGAAIDFLALYRHAAENATIAKAMLGKQGGDLILSHVQTVIAHKLAPPIKKPAHKTKYSVLNARAKEEQMVQFLAEATASALVRLIVCWLEADMPFTEEEMAEQSNALLRILQTP
jgi:AcrR family transcriptional regulator